MDWRSPNSSIVPENGDDAVIRSCPALATIAALMHGNEAGGATVAANAVGAVVLRDGETRGRWLLNLLHEILDDAILEKIYEVVMFEQEWIPKTRFEKEPYGRGKIEGKAELIIRLLQRRGVALSEADLTRITSCRDEEQLARWGDRVLDAHTAADLFIE